MGSDELTDVFEQQRADMETYVREFRELMDLRAELVSRTVALVAEQEAIADV
jgi:hypothetical protein